MAVDVTGHRRPRARRRDYSFRHHASARPAGGSEAKHPTVLFGATSRVTANAFMVDQCAYLARNGWIVHLVTGDGPPQLRDQFCGVRLHTIDMTRTIAPLRDIRSLASWICLVRAVRPDIAMVGTPKAGLLGILASSFCRTPIRIYLLRGLCAEGLHGGVRAISLASEWLACRLSTDVVAVAPSLREKLIACRAHARKTVRVLGRGGSNGVDVDRFRMPTEAGDVAERDRTRERLGIAGDVVVGFVGRLTIGKGLTQALAATRELSDAGRRVKLLVVGDFEVEHPVPPSIVDGLHAHYVVRTGHVTDPAPLFRAMDIYLHLARFEGLPNAVLEASASGLPVITTDATGCRDAVEDGRTGFLVPLDDAATLHARLTDLCDKPELRRGLGLAGRRLVEVDFSNEVVRHNLREYLADRASSLTSEPNETRTAVKRSEKLTMQIPTD